MATKVKVGSQSMEIMILYFSDLLYKDNQVRSIQSFTAKEIDEHVNVITQQQLECEKRGDYSEAEIARQKVQELKEEMARRKREEMNLKQQSERQGLENEHVDEFNKFSSFWDGKANEFQKESDKIEKELIMRHKQEFGLVQEELEKGIPLKPKQSSEALNFQKIEESLARQMNYVEAQKVQMKKNQLESQELQQWNQVRGEKIKKQLSQLQQRQSNEMNEFQQRVISGKNEQKKNRNIELQRLLQKYSNLKKELEIQQKMESNAFEKAMKPKGN